MRHLARLAVVASAVYLSTVFAQVQRPVFRSDSHFVTLDAYPLRDGKVVEGLTAADFVIREDGVPQKVETFEFVGGAAPEPEQFF